MKTRVKPNDPKLSDGRLGRDACAAGGKAAAEAGGVTETPVRCSAWLGASVASDNAFMRSLDLLKAGTALQKAVRELAQSGDVGGVAPLDKVPEQNLVNLSGDVLQLEHELGSASGTSVGLKEAVVLGEKTVSESVPAGDEVGKERIEVWADVGALPKLADELPKSALLEVGTHPVEFVEPQVGVLGEYPSQSEGKLVLGDLHGLQGKSGLEDRTALRIGHVGPRSVSVHGRDVEAPNDPKLSDRSPETPPLPEAALGEGAAPAGLGGGADAVTEPVEPEPGAETERQGCGSLERMVRPADDIGCATAVEMAHNLSRNLRGEIDWPRSLCLLIACLETTRRIPEWKSSPVEEDMRARLEEARGWLRESTGRYLAALTLAATPNPQYSASPPESETDSGRLQPAYGQ